MKGLLPLFTFPSSSHLILPSLPPHLCNSFEVPLKKETKQTIGASVTLKYGVRIDSIKPKEIMDKTKQFQVLDRIVKINGEDVTPLDKLPELKAILDKYAPNLMFTVSRFSGVMLEAAREEIKEVKDAIAKLETS